MFPTLTSDSFAGLTETYHFQDGVTVIVQPSGSGKSLLPAAFDWILTGTVAGETFSAAYIADDAKAASVSLFTAQGNEISCRCTKAGAPIRTIKDKKYTSLESFTAALAELPGTIGAIGKRPDIAHHVLIPGSLYRLASADMGRPLRNLLLSILAPGGIRSVIPGILPSDPDDLKKALDLQTERNRAETIATTARDLAAAERDRLAVDLPVRLDMEPEAWNQYDAAILTWKTGNQKRLDLIAERDRLAADIESPPQTDVDAANAWSGYDTAIREWTTKDAARAAIQQRHTDLAPDIEPPTAKEIEWGHGILANNTAWKSYDTAHAGHILAADGYRLKKEKQAAWDANERKVKELGTCPQEPKSDPKRILSARTERAEAGTREAVATAERARLVAAYKEPIPDCPEVKKPCPLAESKRNEIKDLGTAQKAILDKAQADIKRLDLEIAALENDAKTREKIATWKLQRAALPDLGVRPELPDEPRAPEPPAGPRPVESDVTKAEGIGRASVSASTLQAARVIERKKLPAIPKAEPKPTEPATPRPAADTLERARTAATLQAARVAERARIVVPEAQPEPTPPTTARPTDADRQAATLQRQRLADRERNRIDLEAKEKTADLATKEAARVRDLVVAIRNAPSLLAKRLEVSIPFVRLSFGERTEVLVHTRRPDGEVVYRPPSLASGGERNRADAFFRDWLRKAAGIERLELFVDEAQQLWDVIDPWPMKSEAWSGPVILLFTGPKPKENP